MARKFLVPIDLNGNELLNVVVQQLSAATISGLAGPKGKFVYDTTNNVLKYNTDGTTGGWVALATGSSMSFGSVSGLSVGGSNADGTAGTAARSDHVHSLPGWGVAGSMGTAWAFGDSNSAGTGSTFARIDHKHAAPAAPTLSGLGGVANESGSPALYSAATGSRPAFGTAGRIFIDTTTKRLQRDTGAAWEDLIPFGSGAGSTQAIGDSASDGTATTYARADHKHGMPSFGSVTGQTSYGQSSGNGSAATVARSDHTHGTPSLTSVTPSTMSNGVPASVGTGTAAAKEDHVHAFTTITLSGLGGVANAGSAPSIQSGAFASRPSTGYTLGRLYVDTTNNVVWFDNGSTFTTQLNSFGSPSGSAVGDSQGAGSAYTYARSDHVHAREAFGAVTGQTSYGSPSANGSATTVARSDHTHGTPSLTTNAASAQAPGDSASAGTGTAAAKDDHKHSLPAWGLVGAMAAVAAYGDANAVGTATTFARIDHRHGLPAHGVGQHSSFPISTFAAATADVSMGTSYKITNLANPSSAQDAATKNYVDSVAQGLDFKASVRVVASSNGTLASAYQNAATVDGVTLATGDRILLAGQSTGAENGIYTVNASGAPTRAADADASGELGRGTLVYVEEGSSWASTQWICTAQGATPWVPGSSTSTWTQFSGASTTAAGAGLSVTGQVWSVGAGTGISVGADTVGIDTSVVARKFTTATHASAASFDVTHSLNNQWVTVQVFQVSDNTLVECDVTLKDANNITVAFAQAPTANTLRFVITG